MHGIHGGIASRSCMICWDDLQARTEAARTEAVKHALATDDAIADGVDDSLPEALPFAYGVRGAA